mmetsp:Transcript_26789/g.25820  ORF Transcript_26789/g.25820 Transcript_26789/m.25820 type:complete len:187 (+) Transcript_26789:396-956(+)
MQDEFIKDEELRGNKDVRKRIQKINYTTPKKEELLSQIKDRSNSRSKSPHRDYSQEKDSKYSPPQFKIIEAPHMYEELRPTDLLLENLHAEARATHIVTSDAMERLRRLREEIELKHKQEKIDQAKTVNELVLQHKLFQHSIRALTDDRFNRVSAPSYSSTKVPYHVGELGSLNQFRLESQFQEVP